MSSCLWINIHPPSLPKLSTHHLCGSFLVEVSVLPCQLLVRIPALNSQREPELKQIFWCSYRPSFPFINSAALQTDTPFKASLQGPRGNSLRQDKIPHWPGHERTHSYLRACSGITHTSPVCQSLGLILPSKVTRANWGDIYFPGNVLVPMADVHTLYIRNQFFKRGRTC